VIERDVEIVNRLGLHARAAAKLVHLAGRYQCDVNLVQDGEVVDAKSILIVEQKPLVRMGAMVLFTAPAEQLVS